MTVSEEWKRCVCILGSGRPSVTWSVWSETPVREYFGDTGDDRSRVVIGGRRVVVESVVTLTYVLTDRTPRL